MEKNFTVILVYNRVSRYRFIIIYGIKESKIIQILAATTIIIINFRSLRSTRIITSLASRS